MTEGGQSAGGAGRFWAALVVGIILAGWGIVGHEPCVIVPGNVIAAAGLVLLLLNAGVIGPPSEGGG